VPKSEHDQGKTDPVQSEAVPFAPREPGDVRGVN
jgi:hypothetical protein